MGAIGLWSHGVVLMLPTGRFALESLRDTRLAAHAVRALERTLLGQQAVPPGPAVGAEVAVGHCSALGTLEAAEWTISATRNRSPCSAAAFGSCRLQPLSAST